MPFLRAYRGDENLAEQLQQAAAHCFCWFAILGTPWTGIYCLGMGKIQVPKVWERWREHPCLINELSTRTFQYPNFSTEDK